MSSEADLLTVLRLMAGTSVDDATLGKQVREILGLQQEAGATASPPQRQHVALKVRYPGGKATNICVPTKMYNAAVAVLGGDAAVRGRARQLALQAPETENRSGWVQEQLTAIIQAAHEEAP